MKYELFTPLDIIKEELGSLLTRTKTKKIGRGKIIQSVKTVASLANITENILEDIGLDGRFQMECKRNSVFNPKIIITQTINMI